MSFTHGMNIQEVQDLGNLLQRKAEEIDRLISDVESKVGSTTWVGPDAETFKNQWWPEHKTRLQQVSEGIYGFGQSALNNASEQEEISRVR